jgi:gamma-glutamyltranspeptidase/glutathione hydrolase
MAGAVAAGHPLTAAAGARVLAGGGTAVDACIAAAFVAFVVEGPLAGPTGGGFFLLYGPDTGPTVLDCFFAVPERPLGEMEEVVIDFADAGTQTFHVGDGSVAVPGLLPGLEEAHGRAGSQAWAELLEPAISLAREGFTRDEPRAFLHEILTPILLRTEAGRRVYGDPDRVLTGDLVTTLERVRDDGAGAVRQLLPEFSDDLGAYTVAERAPIYSSVLGREVFATPTPSRGGRIVLDILEQLAEAEDPSLEQRARAIGRAYGARTGPLTGTTHVSVVDDHGRAAGLSMTLGSGSGVFRGGCQLNNMLGELDVIGVEERPAGDRLPSMMTPTLVLEDGRPRLVLGSAGSVRLAGAIAQVAWSVVRSSTALEEAVSAPRVHVEDTTVHLEGGWSDDDAAGLDPSWNVVRWSGRNLFFGGVSAVGLTADAGVAAAGDPRRGGAGVTVP